MDANMDVATGSKGKAARGTKKSELHVLDHAEVARIVDPESECEEQYVFLHNFSVVEDEVEKDDGLGDFPESQLTSWGQLGERFEIVRQPFSGSPGPTCFGEDCTSTNPIAGTQRKSRLHFFRKFLSAQCVTRIITQTNQYVKHLVELTRPECVPPRFAWPPRWAVEWEDLTEAKLMRWIGLLIYMSYHPAEQESDLWSEHWFLSHPGAHRFMTYEEHKAMKAAIHFQSDEESRQDPDTPELLPKKIGLLMKIVRDNFRLHYSPCEVITVDEYVLPLSARHTLRTNRPCDGLVVRGISSVHETGKYVYDLELASNEKDPQRNHKALMRLARKLPRGAGHKIFMSDTYSSVELFNDVAGLGHFCCGELAPGRGGPQCVMRLRGASKSDLTLDGWAVAMSKQGNLSVYAWPATHAQTWMSNFHAPNGDLKPIAHRAGRRGEEAVKAPGAVAEYLTVMESEGVACSGPGQRPNPLNWSGSDKWYHAVLWLLIEACASNAMQLWLQWHQQHEANRQEWMGALCDELLSAYDIAKPDHPPPAFARVVLVGGPHGGAGVGAGDGQGGGTRKRRCLSSEVRSSHRRLIERHFIETADKKRNCALCYHTNPHKSGELQVHHWCARCKVHLHVDCFEEWHTKVDPRSKRVLNARNSVPASAAPPPHPAHPAPMPAPTPQAADGHHLTPAPPPT